MENYLMIDGKRIDLTDEQIKVLSEEHKIVIHRVRKDDEYSCINSTFGLTVDEDDDDNLDAERFEKGNYYPPEYRELARQDAMHDELRSRLRKFTRDNGWDDAVWGKSSISKYYIYKDTATDEFCMYATNRCKRNTIHFISEEVADLAIEEVINPFIESHPDFVW